MIREYRTIREVSGLSLIHIFQISAPRAIAASQRSLYRRISSSSRACRSNDEYWSFSRKAFCCKKSSRIILADSSVRLSAGLSAS